MDVPLSHITGSGTKPLAFDCSSSGMHHVPISVVVNRSEDPDSSKGHSYYLPLSSGSSVQWVRIPRGTGRPAQPAVERLSSFRKQEMDWLEAHKNEFKEYENCWLAIDGDRLVAYGPKLSQVVAEAKRKGVNNPLTVFVPLEEKGISIGF